MVSNLGMNLNFSYVPIFPITLELSVFLFLYTSVRVKIFDLKTWPEPDILFLLQEDFRDSF